MIKTKSGKVEGFVKDGCMCYMGIPYAKKPVGRRAFKHPEPVEPWEGVLQCNHGSKNPIQSYQGFYVDNIDLDSLYLNIFIPENRGDKKLPVMFFIYGGAFTQGGAGAVSEGSTTLEYNMQRFAAQSNTIVVTANYRLNVLGFLNLNSVCKDFDINNGLFDQLLALKWVNDNIKAFGGDDKNITIFGESAGGASVLALMCMDDAKGLFNKAIVQSADIDHFFTYEESAEYARLYLKGANVNRSSELLNMTRDELNEAEEKFSNAVKRNRDIRVCFSPVIDGEVLKGAPIEILKNSDIPLMIGTNEYEGNMFVRGMKTYEIPFIAKLLKLEIRRDAPDLRARASNAITRKVFTEPLDELLKGYGGKAWRYEYRYAVEGSELGCCHASELFVMFGSKATIDGVPIDEDDAVGMRMRRIWGAFAYEGDPGWEEYTAGNNIFIIE